MNKRILVIEDDVSILMGLIDNLEDEGYQVSSEKNGKIGYENALKHDYDLILLDVMLPGMNGFEICKKLKKQNPGLPRILLTILFNLLLSLTITSA